MLSRSIVFATVSIVAATLERSSSAALIAALAPAIPRVAAAYSADAELTVVNAQAIQALKALKTANQDLVKALTDQQYNAADIENLGAQINMLATAIKTVSAR